MIGAEAVDVRRVVTANDATAIGRVASDSVAPRRHDFTFPPGLVQVLVWATDPGSAISTVDPTPGATSIVPGPGGTRLVLLEIPPDPVEPPALTPEEIAADHLLGSPGLAELFEPDGSGMHATPSVDYVVVLSGELTLDLGEGGEVVLGAGDVVVQCGTRHAWRNRSGSPARAAVFLVGTQPPGHANP